jgi:Carboxypeptidase regulatory-like domain/TonB dependent receptor-like, beta-barrel
MRKHLVVLAAVVSVAIACLWHAQPSYGQAATATIRGTVLDPQGKAVPKAKVTARKLDTGQERSTTTSDEGIYVIPNLAPGVYDIRVEATGFNKGEVKGMNLEVGAIRDVNFNLALAGVTTEVKVSAATPLVETTKTDVSTVINDKQMEGLPVLNTAAVSPLNDYAQLAQNSPGVRFDVSNNSFDLIGPGAYNDRGNLVNIDGGNISDQLVSTRDALGASLSEVKEFQIITNNYNAEYGQAGSLIINVITKSGTNAFHGTAFAAFRGRNLAASNYFYNEFDPAAAFGRAPFQKQNWGINAGGPFVKDRTFWFVNFEKVHQSVPLTLTNQAPDFAHSVTVDQPTNEILWSAKVDHQFTRNHQLSIRANFDRQLNDNILVQIANFASPASLTSIVIHDNTFNVGLVSTFTPHVVNEARFFWHRFLNLIPTKSTLPGQDGSDFYLGAAFCCPQGGRQNRYQFIDNLTWSRGTHTIKSGVNISVFPYFSLFQQFHFGSWEDFPSPGAVLSPATCNTSTGTGNCPQSFTFASGPGAVHAGDTISGLYVQDSWKLRPNLTLNYGIRYDYENGAFKGGTVEKTGGGCFQANGIIPACSSDNNNWQPRVGLAWSPGFDSGFLHAVFGGPDRSVVRASIAEVTELAYLNISLDSLNFDGVTLLTNTLAVTPGPSGLLQYFPGAPPQSALASGPSGTFFGRTRPTSDHLRNPESRHLSFDVTRQIRDNYVVHLGYIGVLGFGQFGERDTNFPTILADPMHAGFFYFGDRPDSRFAAIRMQENSRTSAYHGGYIQVQKRYGHHFQAQGSYTYSKTLSSTEDFYGTSEPGDPRNIRAERGLAQNDVRHLGNFSFVFDTNKLVSESFLKHVVNDWNIGIVGLLHSGTPYPISTGEGPFTGSVFFGVGAESSQRPNVLPDGTLIATNIASNSGANLAVGPNGAVVCGCPQTTFLAPAGANASGPVDSFTGDLVDFQFLNGNLARNVGVGDPFYRFDLGVGKTFHVGERVGLEFRADIVNLFNHPNFILFNGADALDFFSIGPPGCFSCIDSGTGKYIGSSGQVLHLSDLQHGRVSSDLTNPVFNGVGDPTAAGDPRIFQLQFKIKW